ncbi:MAG: hypothetical protein GWP05_08175 [Anaerolineaceae bacterium]|nr:hypothetical protein [Anaerolineaceae bacterium]
MRTSDVSDEELHILLAGYVDGELSEDEREYVEEQLARRGELQAVLQEQRAAARSYADYPVEEVAQQQWERMWGHLEERLPEKSKRVSLELLTDIDLGEEFAVEEEPAGEPAMIELATAGGEPAAAKPPPTETEAKPVRLPKKEKRRSLRQRIIRRPRANLWAHAAGLAAAVLVAAMVILSIQPVIRTGQLAVSGEVEFELGADTAAFIDILKVDDENYVQMVWINYSPAENGGYMKEPIQ